MLTKNKTNLTNVSPFHTAQVVSALWKGCHGIWKLAGRQQYESRPLKYLMRLMFLPLALPFWTSCQQRLISEGQKSFPVFSNNSNVQLHDVKSKGICEIRRAQGNPTDLRLFIYSLCCDMTQLFYKKWQRTDTLTISANCCCLLRRRQSYLWWHCQPGTHWVDLLWTLLNYFSTG